MNKRIISLLGALALMLSASGQASVNDEVFNRLDNDSEYINMNADQQDLFNTVVEKTIANMDEKGLVLTDANAQMFLIDTIKGFLGLSKGKEDKKMPAPAPVEEAAAPSGTVFNGMEGGLSLTDANAQYGALWDSIRTGLSGVAQAVSDKLKPKDKDAPAPAPVTTENSLGENLILVDANAQYGALWDSIRTGLSGVAQAVSDKLKPKDKDAPAPATTENSLGENLILVDANAQYGALWDSIRTGLSGVAQAVSDKLKPKDKDAPAPEAPAGE